MRSAEHSTAQVNSNRLKGSGEGKREKVKMSPGGSDFLSHDAELSCSGPVGVFSWKLKAMELHKLPHPLLPLR